MTRAAKLRAIDAIKDHSNGRSLRSAARDHQVERTYCRRRIEGIPTREEYNEGLQKLSKQQEAGLAHWIAIQGRLGYAPPHARFRKYAQRMVINSGSTERLGAKWVTRFLKRNPAIRTIKTRAMDYRRLNGATPASARALHKNLMIPEIQAILQKYRYNADEVGFMEGMGVNGLALGEAF